MSHRFASFLLMVVSAAPALPADIDWAAVKEEAKNLRGKPSTQATDALHQRVRAALGRLEHPDSAADWRRAVPTLRKQLAETIGLARLPAPMPGKLRRLGEAAFDDHVVERIVYETFPDCPVPALVYRPVKSEGKLPAVLVVPGHWRVKSKAEPDTQALCINLARLGFVALTYDPVGQGERGLSYRDHRRTELLLLGISQEGVPVFETLCALAYLRGRDDVDGQRLGLTGASGGGYNTWMTAALDERIAAAIPCVGTSDFQEQLEVCRPRDYFKARDHCHFPAGLLRFANNHELAALIAPRPLLIIAAQEDFSFPLPGVRRVAAHAERLYQALGQPAQFRYFEDDQTGHDYARAKRQAAYGFLQRWLQEKGNGRPVPEPETATLAFDDARLRCFPAGKNQAAGPGILKFVTQEMARLPATPKRTANELRDQLQDVLHLDTSRGPVSLRRGSDHLVGDLKIERISWRRADGVAVPALWLARTGEPKGALLACADGGKESLLDDEIIRQTLADGQAVILADVRGQGELADLPGWNFAVSQLLGENPVGQQAADLCAGRQALAQHSSLAGKPIQVLGSGPVAAQAALFAAILDDRFAGLIHQGGFLTFRSFVERKRELPASFRLLPQRDADWQEVAWKNIDREIPHSLFVFGVLHRFDLPELFAVLGQKARVVRPIDGDWEAVGSR
ncbi:MAG: alpha/beta hydrolase family protein [Gemmataceae bacterium]